MTCIHELDRELNQCSKCHVQYNILEPCFTDIYNEEHLFYKTDSYKYKCRFCNVIIDTRLLYNCPQRIWLNE